MVGMDLLNKVTHDSFIIPELYLFFLLHQGLCF